jgi:hypothetical protein
MTDKRGLADEAAEGVRTLFSRLGEFFHIFDLSFLVSGVLTLSALIFLFMRLGFRLELPFAGWVSGLALIIVAYVCGLVSFALGRSLNGKLFRRTALANLKAAVVGQGLTGEAVRKFLDSEEPTGFPLWRLYIRLWQQLAYKHPHSVAFHHLSRYWAMAATYDGVAVSLMVWTIVVTPVDLFGSVYLSLPLTLVVMLALLFASLLCLRQGAKYYEFQVEDLVAALAVAQSRID